MERAVTYRQAALDFADSPDTAPQARYGRATSRPFRPIHYLGSKLRILPLVREVVDTVASSGGAVCDLFAGSGTVSRALSTSRNVISVDIQEYSRVLCSALLNPAQVTQEVARQFIGHAFSSEQARRLIWAIEPMATHEEYCRFHSARGVVEPLCQLLEQGSIVSFQLGAAQVKDAALSAALRDTVRRMREAGLAEGPVSTATRYFGGIYFSYTQAAQIDILLEAVFSIPPLHRDTFLAAVLSTASDVVNTVGKQFAQPIRPRYRDGRPKMNLSRRVARDRSIDVRNTYQEWLERYLAEPRSGWEHEVIRGDFADVLDGLAGRLSVIYADPPYTRDHYSRYYHVLETLCLRDCPSISTVVVDGSHRISRGIYRTDRYQSPFCIKSQAPNAFSTLFTKSRRLGVPLVVSYSPYEKSTGARPRLMPIKDIAKMAKASFSSVEIISAGRISHSKLNRSDMNKVGSHAAEMLIVCKP
jgi:adenine-specific DNA-methyltransferase